jgi:surface protein
MEWMFYECYKLESLDISSFRTPNVKSMAAMFVRCKSLTTIDVSQFDTSKVIDAFNMFEDCPQITSLDLSRFTTSSIENMRSMFLNSNKLISLDLSNFDFTQVTDIKHMFAGCSNLKYINIKSLIINDNIEYTEFINNALLNPIICIDDMQSLNKIISLYRCHHLEDPENWGLYKDNIADDNNIFINNCLLSKNDTNCYQICSFYYYYDDRLSKYICTEDLKCPKTYEKLIHGKNECIKSCDETNDHNYELLIGKVWLKNCSDNFYEPYDKPFSCIPKCPSEHPFLFVESLECVSHCTIKQRQDKLCVTCNILYSLKRSKLSNI